jgi:phosphatidylglycerophosphatase A
VKHYLLRLICSGFGSGLTTLAPGTFGSAAALAIWHLAHRTSMLGSWIGNASLAAITTAVGTFAVMHTIRLDTQESDPQWIVIDEWAGMFIALLVVPPSNWVLSLVAFAIFRILDASKLGPVGWAEQLPGALGIMADDVVAGILTALLLVGVRMLLPI